MPCKNNEFKISEQTLNEKFELLDHPILYQIFTINLTISSKT